ncbi:MAG TPA: tetratricopeptide repeat protein [Pyrinomonadaceae bacterium]|jgi:tetratricopeptide (TPR) repeat protein
MIRNFSRLSVTASVLIGIVSLVCVSHAQTDDVAMLRAQGQLLLAQYKYVDAIPVYDRLVKLTPDDPVAWRNYGSCLLAQAQTLKDEAASRQTRIRAREAFVKANQLGEDSLFVKGMIDGISADGAPPKGFSDNAAANKVMEEAESFFAQGKMDDAFQSYQKALALDPRCYYAALFSGDVMMQEEKFDEAEKWYQRAITIDSFKETAYRYSATPLMRQKKYDQARDRYVEAFILSPFDKLARSGIVGWAQTTNKGLSHPKIDVPETKTGPDGKPITNITVSTADDGSMAWISYTTTRDEWQKEMFARTFPKERTYRHSLLEEVNALRSVVSMARSLKPKQLNSQIALLEQMDKDGVLEAYVLLARTDDGIFKDYDDYVHAHRDKLRQYVMKYVIQDPGDKPN